MENRRVVVIDDDKKFLAEMEDLLRMGGYDPVLVADTSSIAEAVIQTESDVILLELSVPRKNAFELTSALQKPGSSRRAPIIAMSSFFKDEFAWLLNFCGIKRWLRKPFQPLNFFWAIENEIDVSHDQERQMSLTSIEVSA